VNARPWLAVLAALLVFPGAASAQWPVGQGKYWGKLSFFRHQTTEQFRASGEKKPFINANAESRSSAVFFDGLVGLTDRLDFWAQVPYFDLNFDDDSEERHSSGVGDVRLSARYNLFQLRQGSLPLSVRFTTKIPIVDFPIDAEVIPVGEGQWDYEVWLESGISLWPLPAYSVVWLGYRFRAINEKTTRDPGDELTFLAELGGTSLVGGLGGKVVVDGIFGRTGAIQGIPVSNDQREILYLGPTLLYDFGGSTMLEVAVRIPLLGRNLPAGNQVAVALFHSGSLWK
jgi:Putative MetA-pathway of phenol degradation